ncbi:MAG: methyltransferase, partial [Verrucomicrobiae bacterium]|nr:methyltransferase [Verrucomicrobiae bacterium]
MNARKRNRILDAVFAGLRPGGVFVSVGCVHACWFPGARCYLSRLRSHFSTVVTSPVVWGNMPPAFVYCCR